MLVPGLIVSDMVYTPRETELLLRAKAKGNKPLDGVGVFLQQAAIGERLGLVVRCLLIMCVNGSLPSSVFFAINFKLRN